MGRPDGRIEKGQPLNRAISARAWNRAQDAADVVLGVRPGFEAGEIKAFSAPYTWVYLANKTGSAVSRWAVLKIDGVEIVPTSDDAARPTSSFQEMPVVTGKAHDATTASWCVVVEPIANNAIGRAAVAGVVQIKAGDLGKASGAQVLYKNNDWALIVITGSLRLGSVSATWAKGATATVTEQNGDGTAKPGTPTPTFEAINYFATVTVTSGSKRVACGRIDDKWVLIAAEC